MQLEVCSTNLESCLAARDGGAHRVELCAALDVGGVTPSVGLIATAVKIAQLPLHVLIRPREGNFYFSKREQQIMLADIENCVALGVSGIVVGALQTSGNFDGTFMKKMARAAQHVDISCHRAFDCCPNPFDALEQLIDWGFARVLTSGRAASAFDGRFLIQQLVEHANGRIGIMPGGGIHSGNILDLAKTTRATHFHVSAKRKKSLPHDTTHTLALPYKDYWVSSVAEIRAIRQLLDDFSRHNTDG